MVLYQIALHPGWDGDQVATEIGEDAFEVSWVISEMMDEGLLGLPG